MNIVRSFPLLLFPVVLYNGIAFLSSWTQEEVDRCSEIVGENVHPLTCELSEPWFKIPMIAMSTVGTRRSAAIDPMAGKPEKVNHDTDGAPAMTLAPPLVPEPREPVARQLYLACSLGDVILTLSLLLLFAEVLSATGVQQSSIVNHSLSLIVFIVGLFEFLTWPACATPVFFLIILMSCLDVLAGFIVTIAAVRRDLSFVGS